MAQVSRLPEFVSRNPGSIEVICGPMFSGKTEELIRRLRRAQIARQRVFCFKPSRDTRYADADIVSHSAQHLSSIPVSSAVEIESFLNNQSLLPDVLGIDEVQFFDDRIVGIADAMAGQGVRVIVAGLDLDYRAEPFGPMPRLLAISESVTKVLAVCIACGAPASRSQRVAHDCRVDAQSKDRVLVGATDAYEARCRRCFIDGVDTPSLPNVN